MPIKQQAAGVLLSHSPGRGTGITRPGEVNTRPGSGYAWGRVRGSALGWDTGVATVCTTCIP